MPDPNAYLSAREFFSAVIEALNENGERADADGKTTQNVSPLAILKDRN